MGHPATTRRFILGAGLALAAGRQTRAATDAQRPILLIGATAKSAPEIIIHALAQGRHVTALARRPAAVVASLPEALRAHPLLQVVKGDAYDVDSLAAAMTGREAVISVIAPHVDPADSREITSIDIYSVGTANIVFAMQRKGNRRLIPVSSGGTEMLMEEKPPASQATLTFVWTHRGLYQDMVRMEKIARASGLEVVIPRPRRFVAEPARHDLKFAVDTPQPPVISTLTYADFADWILAAADSDAYVGKTVGIYTDRRP